MIYLCSDDDDVNENDEILSFYFFCISCTFSRKGKDDLDYDKLKFSIFLVGHNHQNNQHHLV